MADQDAQDTETLVKDEKEEVLDIDSQINAAMRARIAHFKEQSEYSLSLFFVIFGIGEIGFLRELLLIWSAKIVVHAYIARGPCNYGWRKFILWFFCLIWVLIMFRVVYNIYIKIYICISMGLCMQ